MFGSKFPIFRLRLVFCVAKRQAKIWPCPTRLPNPGLSRKPQEAFSRSHICSCLGASRFSGASLPNDSYHFLSMVFDCVPNCWIPPRKLVDCGLKNPVHSSSSLNEEVTGVSRLLAAKPSSYSSNFLSSSSVIFWELPD